MERLGLYKNVHPLFEKAIQWVQSTNFDDLPDGQTNIQGDDIYALKSTYNTRDISTIDFEGHKKYIDLQIVYTGNENVEIAFLKGGEKVTRPFSEETDKYKVQTDRDSTFLFKAGEFAFFFPADLHKCCINVDDKASEVRKLVLKIKYQN